MAWRTWWKLASFLIPLQLLAAGFTAIFEGRMSGTARGIDAIAKIGQIPAQHMKSVLIDADVSEIVLRGID